jgi:hypothetical protein
VYWVETLNSLDINVGGMEEVTSNCWLRLYGSLSLLFYRASSLRVKLRVV